MGKIKKTILFIFITFILAGWIGCKFKDTPQNIIIVSLDTLRADHLSCYGYQRNTSPNIDLLAKNAIKFSNVFSQSSWTLPSHMSFFTSRYPSFHKVKTTEHTLNPKIKTLAEILKENGYTTVAFTEGGNLFRIYGFGRGFDIYEEKSKDIEFTFNQALRWLRKERGNNKFFLFIHTYEIHTPYLRTTFADPKKRGRLPKTLKVGDLLYDIMYGRFKLSDKEKDYIRSLYDSGILYADSYIGKLIECLRELKLMDNTTLLIFSDHGEDLWDHGISPAHGVTLYQDQLHVPVILYNRRLPYPKEIDAPVQLIDFMPTLLAINNIPIPKGLQGKNLLPLIMNKSSIEDKRPIFSEGTDYGPNRIAVILNGYKYVFIPDPKKTKRDLSIERLKNLEVGLDVNSLFNLNLDPQEKRNIYSENIEKARKMHQLIEDMYVSKSKTIPEFHLKHFLINDQIERLRSLGYIK